MAQRLVGRYHDEPVFDNDDWDADTRCPSCGLQSGERDEDHSKIGLPFFVCAQCGYSWNEAEDIMDWREDR
jgi:rubredoxin